MLPAKARDTTSPARRISCLFSTDSAFRLPVRAHTHLSLFTYHLQTQTNTATMVCYSTPPELSRLTFAVHSTKRVW
jgi:hypothetical protein